MRRVAAAGSVGLGIATVVLLGALSSSHAQTTPRIMFDLDGRIFSIRPDGSNVIPLSRPVSETGGYDSNPAVSPDGNRIAFTHGSDIWTMAVDGSDRAQLTFPDSRGGDGGPVWFPDGGRIAFVCSQKSQGPDPPSEICAVNLDGADRTQLTCRGSGGDCFPGYPYWSPDGQRLAYSMGYAVWLADADGSDPTLLVSEACCPAWSPDGTRIAFLRSDPEGPYDYVDIWTMDLDGRNLMNLTATWPFCCKTILGLAWSPDGGKIAFHTWHEGGTFSQLFVMEADGSNPLRLGFGQNAAWFVGLHRSAQSWAEIKMKSR